MCAKSKRAETLVDGPRAKQCMVKPIGNALGRNSAHVALTELLSGETVHVISLVDGPWVKQCVIELIKNALGRNSAHVTLTESLSSETVHNFTLSGSLSSKKMYI